MWEVLQLWIGQGIRHIIDLDAYDHLLYIIALSLPFSLGRYRILTLQVTAFTLGHTLALVIAASTSLPMIKTWVEIGILLSILLTAIHGIAFTSRANVSLPHYLVTIGVGCIHGLGFGSFFAQLHPEKGTEFVTSLVGFNLGVEVGQLIIVIGLITLMRLLSLVGAPTPQVSKGIHLIIAIISLLLLARLLMGN